MYTDKFDTDWESLTVDEASRRAYALGVSDSLGEPMPEEFDRIKDEIGKAYDRSLVELAYEEGRTRARELSRDAETDSEDNVWNALVEAEPITTGFGDPDETGIPKAVTLGDFLDPPGDGLDKVKLPEFLTRRQG